MFEIVYIEEKVLEKRERIKDEQKGILEEESRQMEEGRLNNANVKGLASIKMIISSHKMGKEGIM